MPRRNPIPEPPQVFDTPTEEATFTEIVANAREAAEAVIATIGNYEEPVDEEIEINERAVAVIPQQGPSHHVVTGMATLAAMSDADFLASIAVMKAGQERVKIIQKELMTEGEDYGKVNGIERPFLHQPGAEKLANFYGLAVRYEVDRIMGTLDAATGVWLSPPVSYIARAFVHVGNFDGPIVAEGRGECNSWEDKYRYRWSKPSCPQCGHDLMRGGKDGKMAGKWFCPGFKGGCWWSVDIRAVDTEGKPVIAPSQKIDNPDPLGQAETLLQMAVKRAKVAAVRAATGTSGLFTQDDDVVRAAQGDEPDAADPVVESATIGIPVQPGAKIEGQTQVQQNRLKALVQEKELTPVKIADLLAALFRIETEPTGPAVSAAVRALDGVQIGRLIYAIETGDMGAPPPPDDDEVLARALMPDDIGAK